MQFVNYFNKVPLSDLIQFAKRTAIIGGIGTFIIINTVPYIISTKLAYSRQYQEAIELLHNHPDAVEYLGEPITEKRVNVSNQDHFGQNGEYLYVNIPIVGSKDKGNLFYTYADSHEHIATAELSLNSVKNYKLILKKEELI